MKPPKRRRPAPRSESRPTEIDFPFKEGRDKAHRPGRHEVSHKQAIRMRTAAIALFGKEGFGGAASYHREIFDKILRDERCVGVRFYPGIDERGCITILFCGFDRKGNNILAGTIGDFPYRCPPFCPPVKDGIVEF